MFATAEISDQMVSLSFFLICPPLGGSFLCDFIYMLKQDGMTNSAESTDGQEMGSISPCHARSCMTDDVVYNEAIIRGRY